MRRQLQYSIVTPLIWIFSVISACKHPEVCFEIQHLWCISEEFCNYGNCLRTTKSMIIDHETAASIQNCPHGFDKYKKYCLKVDYVRKSWDEATNDGANGHIMSLFTKEDAEISAEYLRMKLPGPNISVWTSGRIYDNNNSSVLSWYDEPTGSWHGSNTFSSLLPLEDNTCLALRSNNYTYWDLVNCETKLLSLRSAHLHTGDDYMCLCNPGYQGEFCYSEISLYDTYELENPQSIQCIPDTFIYIEYAAYKYKAKGSPHTICKAPNAFTLLRYLCQGKRFCALEPSVLKSYLGYVCDEISPILTVDYSCLPRNETTCPRGTIKIEALGSENCVLVTHQKATWNETMKLCQDHGGQLAAFYDSISFRKIDAFAVALKDITAFWILEQVPDIRPNARRPDVCTKAMIGTEMDPTHLTVVRECSGNLHGLCAFPPFRYDVVRIHSTRLQKILHDETEIDTIEDDPTETLLNGKYCPAQSYGGLNWPSVTHGANIILHCPQGQRGSASWTCEANGEYNSTGPDFHRCLTSMTNDIYKLYNELDEGTHPDVVVTNLAVTLQMAETISSGDLLKAINLLDHSINVQRGIVHSITEEREREETMNTFTLGVVNATGVVLATKSLTSWFGLNTIYRAEAADKLIADVDTTGILHASVLTKTTRTTFKIGGKLHLYIEARNITDHSQLELPNIIVPSEAFRIVNRPDSMGNLPNVVPIVVTTYNTIGLIMPIGDHFQNFTNVTQVIGATLNKTIQLAHDKVSVIIEKPTGVISLNRSLCVFWNGSQWSTDGCELSDETNDTHFVCKCDHMTSFAVLMSFNPRKVDIMALNIITITGCSVSILCLAACIITILIVRSLRTFCYKVHLHLCISLMIADTALIAAHYYKAYHVEVDKYCTALAMLLHYFYLATFMWMFLEGVQIYLALVRVFAPARNRGYVYYLIGYGIPGLVVGISAGVNMEGYASATHCFLDTESGLIWGFIAFVLLTLFFNTVLLFLSLKSASRLKHMRNAKQTESAKQWLWQITILHPLLGLTWYFGLLQFGDQLVFSYVFTILNSLQGTFIFMFHVFRNEDVRHYFARIYFTCGANDAGNKRITRTPAESSRGQSEEGEREHIVTNRQLGPSNRRKKDIAMDKITSGHIEADLNERDVLHSAHVVDRNFTNN